MIVVTSLLILVAVALFGLGLAAGSSTLLIFSIVASLLASVVLVVGARRAATRRRADDVAKSGDHGPAAGPDEDPFIAEGQSPAEFAMAGNHHESGEGPAGTHTVQAARAAESARRAPAADFPPSPPVADFPSSSPVADFPPSSPAADFPPPPPPGGLPPSSPVADFPSSPLDADFPPPPPASESPVFGSPMDEFPPPPGRAADDDDDMDLDAVDEERYAREAAEFGEQRSDFSGSDPILGKPGAPDYDRASSVIGAARSENPDESWRRDHTRQDPSHRGGDLSDGPLLLDEDEPAGPGVTTTANAAGATGPAQARSDAPRAPEDEDFDEADEEDPEDEPLPQAVRPGDAIRVARMDDEVLVVDGRPRYHVADCQHLTGRLTEPLPVSEAVELGFNPCGLCRPVDRLIAQTTRR